MIQDALCEIETKHKNTTFSAIPFPVLNQLLNFIVHWNKIKFGSRMGQVSRSCDFCPSFAEIYRDTYNVPEILSPSFNVEQTAGTACCLPFLDFQRPKASTESRGATPDQITPQAENKIYTNDHSLPFLVDHKLLPSPWAQQTLPQKQPRD